MKQAILILALLLAIAIGASAAKVQTPSALELRLEALEARVAELEKRPNIGIYPPVDPGICPMPSYPFDWKDMLTPISTFVPYVSPQGRILLNLNDCGGAK